MGLKTPPPIRFRFLSGMTCPSFICAACGQPLEHPGMQMIVWDMAKEAGECPLMPVHKGRCLHAVERQIESLDGGRMGSQELADFMANLIDNSGYQTPSKGENWTGIGTLYQGGALKSRPEALEKARELARREFPDDA